MRILALVTAAALVLAACSSATGGSGGGTASGSSPTAASTLTHGPASSAVARSTAVIAPSSSVPPPVAAKPPAACNRGKCTKVASGDLGGGYVATVFAGPSPTGQIAAEYLQLALHGVAVFWKVTDGYHPGQLICSARPAPNCAVEDAFGAHASSARGLVRKGNKLVVFDEAMSDTPVTDVWDLNSDGWIDVLAMQNTYEPDYATGKVYWSTALSNGTTFSTSGCTPPKRRLPPKPAAPLTGKCAS